MERVKLFIASSSEGLGVVRAVRGRLLEELGDEAEVSPWTREFDYSANYIESLERASSEADFAVAVMTPDDLTRSREKDSVVPRDNVVFELGLFMGSLGRERCFIVTESRPDLKLPSDLLGVKSATFKRPDDGDLKAAVDVVCYRIAERVSKLRRRRRLGRDDRETQDAIADFGERVDGWWWERIDTADASRISFFRIAPDPLFNAVVLNGKAYDEHGARAARWRSVMARVDVAARHVLYHWHGDHKRPDIANLEFHGFGEMEFNAPANPRDNFSRGEGKFWNVDQAHPERTTLRPVQLRRETNARIITTMNDGTEKDITSVVLGALEPW